jgi:hypothetical protein
VAAAALAAVDFMAAALGATMAARPVAEPIMARLIAARLIAEASIAAAALLSSADAAPGDAAMAGLPGERSRPAPPSVS